MEYPQTPPQAQPQSQYQQPPIENISNVDPVPSYHQQQQQQQPINPEKPFPEPQPQFQPQPQRQPQPANTIVPTAAPQTITPLELLGEEPCYIDCPFCHRRTLTRTQKDDSTTTCLASVLLCLVCICLVCLPQMAGWAQDITHFCTNCGAKVAFRPHDGQTQVMRPMAASEYVSKYQPVAEPAPAYKPAG